MYSKQKKRTLEKSVTRNNAQVSITNLSHRHHFNSSVDLLEARS